MLSDVKIVEQFKKDKSESQRLLAKQYENSKMCQAFYSGNIMRYSDKMQFATNGKKKRAMVQFNKVKPYVNAVKGFMAQNRREAHYIARERDSGQQKAYSQYANALAEYIRDNANYDQIETHQDGDMLICGYGATETAVSYMEGYSSSNPNGEILKGRLDPLNVGWDPHARAANLLDSRFVWYRKEYYLDDALSLFEEAKEEDFEPDQDSDGDYEYMERGGRYDQIKESGLDWAHKNDEIVNVYFYQWIEYETYYRADNPAYKFSNPQAVAVAAAKLDEIARGSEDFDAKADIISFDDETKKKLEEAFNDEVNTFIDPEPFQRKVYYTCVLSGKKVFTKFKSISQKSFSIQFKTGEFDEENKIWTGMVNSMKDPVLYYNKALTELMFIIGANSKGGVMYEKGAIEDISEFEQKYAKTDASVEVSDGAIAEGRIRAKREPFMPTGYENIIQMADASLNDVNGIDKSFLGSSENRQETGILQRRRIKQVVSSLACYFDSISLYQKMDSRILLDYMRVYAENNVGGLFKLLGENGETTFLEISNDNLTNDYDVTIKESPQSAEEKQEQAQMISMIADKFLGIGDVQSAKALYSVALGYTTLEEKELQAINKVLQPQDVDPQYVAQLEAQVKELLSQQNQVLMKKQMTDIAKDQADIQKTSKEVEKIAADIDNQKAKTGQTMIENRMMQEENVQARVVI